MAEEISNLPSLIWDVRDEFSDIQNLVMNVPNEILEVPDEILDVPDEFSDVQNLVMNVPNEILDVPEEILDVRDEIQHVPNLVWNIQNAVPNVPDGDLNVQSLVADIRLQILDKGNSIFSGGNVMAYKRRASQVIAEAQERATNLKAIDPALDLGGGLTVTVFDDEIAAVQTALAAYNTLLAKADAAANELNALEKQLGTLSGRMLAGVGVRFGKDSSEYEMAGGVRTSEIKRGGKKEEPEGGGA